MIYKNIDAIDFSDIQALVNNQVPEGKRLDYKQELPDNSDGKKKEFLADVLSFANTSGGDLIFGVSEKPNDALETNDTEHFVCGLSEVDFDAEILRLENMIRDGISPRVVGIQTRGIQRSDSGCKVMIIRIPQSFNAPHMVTFKNLSRFYARNSAGKYQMDVDEIRIGFLAANSIIERVKEFRIERVKEISSEYGQPRLQKGEILPPRLAVHLIPLESVSSVGAIDVLPIVKEKQLSINPIHSEAYQTRYNFDGIFAYAQGENGLATSYIQLYRNGVIEAVDTQLLKRVNSERLIDSVQLEKTLIESIRSYLKLQNELGLDSPVVIAISLINVRGYGMLVPKGWAEKEVIERQSLIVQEVMIDGEAEIHETLQSAFDSIWQACGWERSYGYLDSGEWVGSDQYPG